MTLGTKSILALSLCAALGAACKKKAEEAPKAGTASPPPVVIDAAPPSIDAAPAPAIDAAVAAAPSASTPELDALAATMTPLMAMADEDARTKAACKALPTITGQIAAVGKHPPAGADAAAWLAIAEGMAGGLSDFEIECGEGTATSTRALTEAMDSGKEFAALLAKPAP